MSSLELTEAPVVSVVVSGRAHVLTHVLEVSDATLWAGYAGPYGPQAVVEALVGDAGMPGRLPVKVTVGEWDPDVVSAAIRDELARRGQVYYVSNRVHTIDDAVERVREAAPEARIGVAHGKMSAREVEDVMLQFQEHEVDVLVATTIIESGIDNPHTNTLIIEDSQRLGLAQLYQLKGRVGRGRTQAFAYFMFPAEQPLTPEATDRLTAINEYQDLGSGMKIAMRDLEIRGAGSLMGAEQHGNLSSAHGRRAARQPLQRGL